MVYWRETGDALGASAGKRWSEGSRGEDLGTGMRIMRKWCVCVEEVAGRGTGDENGWKSDIFFFERENSLMNTILPANTGIMDTL